ncbi:hypothetical protein IWQ57_000275 [Coemansia nantahalensis]|uniref:Uncharacterized protein n=2 Tax=Coemansia TaxID=4863 RepID=A0ACC1KX59_9FUNG|nr:hypothetical protein IWQ57_000275 [Coemansia nantahalensis]KAJ2796602.1 hypothetical protein H4R21_004647 [Coemansia helicoidea]
MAAAAPTQGRGSGSGSGAPAGERTPLLYVGYCPPPKPLSAEDVAQRRRSLGILSELSVELLSAGPTPECLSASDSLYGSRVSLPGGAAGDGSSASRGRSPLRCPCWGSAAAPSPP